VEALTSTSVSSAALSLRIFSAMRSSSANDKCAFWLAMVLRLFREGDANLDIAEACRGRAMSGAHHLLGLALATVGSAPQRPIVPRTNGVATVPEFRGDPAVAGILDHATSLTPLDLPADFRRKLEMISLVVNGPGAVRLHQDRVVGIGDQVFILPGAGIDADVGHANHGQAVPAFAAHCASGALLTDGRGSFAATEVPGEQAVGDDRRALRRKTLVVVGKRAQTRPVLQARVGDYVDDVGAVLQFAQFLCGQEAHAREIRFHPEDTVKFDRVADGFVNLQAQ